MKSIKLALLGGAALAVTSAAAHADDLDALKAQIESLNARVATMEAAPSVPSGYQLIAITDGPQKVAPGLEMSKGDQFTYGNRATVISVLPTADAPAGATITWSGQVRAGLVYNDVNDDTRLEFYNANGFNTGSEDYNDDNGGDIDVRAEARLRVVASTDTAVGEVGVQMELRGKFNGLGTGDAYFKEAWGYWAMTPELTFGGGYTGSLGNIGFGVDGSCTCIWTDASDAFAYDPGDTTQLRLSYASGPFSAAIALEDAGFNNGAGNDNGVGDYYNYEGDELGVAAELKYTGDTMSGEISGVWRQVDGDGVGYSGYGYDSLDDFWQVGAGLGFNLGEMVSLSIMGAFGEGPFNFNDPGELTDSYDYAFNGSFWGASALASIGISDAVHAEIGAGYKHRESDGFYSDCCTEGYSNGVDYDAWGVLGGIYYTPVSQLTIGLEAEWNTIDENFTMDYIDDTSTTSDRNYDQLIVDLAAVWRF